MCPDPKLLSIYMDGELPSPWKEKMESHLAECDICKKKFDDFKRLQELFKKDTNRKRVIAERSNTNETAYTESELMEASKERVWQKLALRQKYSPLGQTHRSRNLRHTVWNRRFSVPVPVAAAAALLLVFGAVFFRQSPKPNEIYIPQITEYPNYPEDMSSIYLPVAQDMNSVLQYLGADGTDIIILQLPESKSFSKAGEPQIIRAADFTRIEDVRIDNSRIDNSRRAP